MPPDMALVLARGAELEPAAVEHLSWYLRTHPDAAAVTCFQVHRRAAGSRLDTAGGRDWRELLGGRDGPGVAVVRAAELDLVPASSRADPRAVLLACGERGLAIGTVPEFLCWTGSAGAEPAPGGYPRLLAGQYPPHPREHSLPFEAVPSLAEPDAAPGGTDPKSILFIVPWFTLGGADKFNLRLAQQLIGRGWKVTLAATNRGDQSWLADFTEFTADVHVLPHFVRPDAAPLFLRHLIRTRRPEVVLVSNSELGYLCLPYLRHHEPGPVYVDYSHMEEPRWKNGGWSRYGAAWQDHLELNIVTSNHLKRWMVSKGAEESRVEVCTINEDPDLWQAPAGAREQFRAAHRIPAATPVILYAARICEQKKPHVFIRTVHALRDRGVEFIALVAGDGPDRHELETYVRRHGLGEHVRLLLAVPPSDMTAIYAASDLIFLPSDREGIALVLFEAMAAGLPVVGAAVGGQSELVTPECGILHPKADDEQEVRTFTDTLSGLLPDAARRRRMGEAGRARIRDHFSLDAMGDRMVGLFAKAREHARTSPRPAVTGRTAQELATLAVEYLRADHEPPPPSLAVPLRYRIVDRLNLTLKRFGLSAPIKKLVSRVSSADGA